MKTIQDRLKFFIASIDKSVLSFENQCGIAPGTVSKMTDKSRLRTLERISKHFPQLNMEWLKTGEGEMLIGEKGGVRSAGRDYVERGKIEHKGGEEQAVIIADLRAQIEQLKSQLNDKERIIALYERMLKN